MPSKESYFNPRSREGSDSIFSSSQIIFPISIHAPARGATNRTTLMKRHVKNISIHAPARGATSIKVGHLRTCAVFQSTLPRGERRRSESYRRTKEMISIHAPARGATYLTQLENKGYIISIHAPARGATIRPSVFYSMPKGISIHAPARGATPTFSFSPPTRQFQSTLPRGERLQFYLKFTLCF